VGTELDEPAVKPSGYPAVVHLFVDRSRAANPERLPCVADGLSDDLGPIEDAELEAELAVVLIGLGQDQKDLLSV
jgi:hypothetical protein